MSRKRSPEHDYICIRCGCACTPPGTAEQRHLGGGSVNMRACGKPPHPMLRSEYEAMIVSDLESLRGRLNP